MRWKTKARIQKAVSLLPSSLSYNVYYRMQRRFGALRQVNPVSRFEAAIATWNLIDSQGYSPSEKVFLEVGTGRVPVAPLAYWLMGARRVVTIDLNPYMNAELLKESLQYVTDHRQEVTSLFGDTLHHDRLEALLDFAGRPEISIASLLSQFPITYEAPGDAAATTLEENSVDFHTSHDVLEHIPFDKLVGIVKEGNRITKNNGLFVHRIDYSDHFSHTDSSISAINFLQYTDSQWHAYAGNRYMYMNRLRHDDYIRLLEQCGHKIVACKPSTDSRVRQLLESGQFAVDDRFRGKSSNILSIIGSWMVSQQA